MAGNSGPTGPMALVPAPASPNRTCWGRSASLAAIGCIAFAVGFLVYLTDRDPSKAPLIPTVAWLSGRNVFGPVGGCLPSFVHTFSFSLFTAAVLPQRFAPAYGACAAWFVVNAVFELGQHPLVSARLADVLKGDPGGLPLTRPLANYFVRGTFDPGDIVAALLGALAAGVALRIMQLDPKENHA